MTTALAVGLAAGPASAQAGPPSEAGVQPLEFLGTPDLVCPPGEMVTGLSVPPEDLTFPVNIPNDGSGVVTVDVTDTAQGEIFSFSIEGDIAATQVTAVGGTNANVYMYNATTGFPGGIAADAQLHAPLGQGPDGSQYEDLIRIDFCFKPSPYNGNG
ncbi:hypothetical protein [Streptomyces bicolor]|uniref:hypothetical protein n=1 Tax=Streptomyces bicolor TaxID=66874 RepID=UPI0004E2777B|nr:hypothetical protein [Streptomyces bicolor]